MPAAIKWETTSTSRTAIDLGTTLASDTLSSAGTEIDNSTNLDTYGWLEVATSSGNLFSSAVTRAHATFDIYMITAPDGTNYQNTPVTADIDEFMYLQVAQIDCPTEAGVVPAVANIPIALPPHKFKLLLYNNTNQTMQNTWELNLYTNNLESQ